MNNNNKNLNTMPLFLLNRYNTNSTNKRSSALFLASLALFSGCSSSLGALRYVFVFLSFFLSFCSPGRIINPIGFGPVNPLTLSLAHVKHKTVYSSAEEQRAIGFETHLNRHPGRLRERGHHGCLSRIWHRFAIPSSRGYHRAARNTKCRRFHDRVTSDRRVGECTSGVSLFRGKLFKYEFSMNDDEEEEQFSVV